MGQNEKLRGRFLRSLRFLLVAVMVLYLGVCALVFCFQRKLLYLPPVRSPEQTRSRAHQAGLERWTNSSGVYLGMKRPAEASVLICYGNASSATGCACYADALQSLAPLDVFILQYPGYEDKSGEPTRGTLFAAAVQGLGVMSTNQPVFLLGESLGTGVASYLAGEFPDRVSGVMLLAPYERLADVAQYQYPWLPARWLTLDDFRSGNYLAMYHGPVGVMVDGRDTIVPARFGLKLFNGYAGRKHLWRFSELGHAQIGEPQEKFWRGVLEFWQVKMN